MPFDYPAIATVLLCILALSVQTFLHRRSRRLPPGPSGYPLIGNLLDIPTEYEWKVYSAYARQYGDILSLHIPGTTLIVLSSYTLCLSLLDRKGSLYSDRPYFTMTGTLIGFDRGTLFLPYRSDRFRQSRKWWANEMGTMRKVEAAEGGIARHIEEAANTFVQNVTRDPEALFDYIYLHAGAVILRTTYGYHPTEPNDYFLKLANDAMSAFNESLYPGRFLCNQLPFLRHVPAWFPGGGFQKTALEWRKILEDSAYLPLEWTRKQISEGAAKDSFITKALRSGVQADDEENLAFTAVAMSEGGSDTSAVALSALFVFLARNPVVQARAQAEIDSLVGAPTVENTTQDQLPYLDALLKEVLRCHPPVPLGIPHRVMEDDWHEGHFIPKGATIIPNLWHMLSDSQLYADPSRFNPSRFLGPNPELDPKKIVFGFGRRICPGRVLAEVSLRVTAAIVLSSFEVRGPTEGNGDEILPEYKPISGAISHLERVKISVTLRIKSFTGT